jgi:hypothetical protein
MAFSGGSYDEVRRWLWNFLTAHAKREDPRFEVEVEAGDAREGKSYGARLVLGARRSENLEFDYAEVAARRGDLGWCRALADRVRHHARAVMAEAGERRTGVG